MMTNTIQTKKTYENIYNHLKEYMFYPDVIQRVTSAVDAVHQTNTAYSASASAKVAANIAECAANVVAKEVLQSKTASLANNNIHNKKEKDDDETPFFIPQEKDKLFWCLYIFIHGYYEYKIAKNNSFVIEKKWKMDTLAKLKEKDVLDFLKTNKMKVTDLEDEYMNKEKLSLKGLQVFCFIHKFSVMYISGRKYCEFICDTATKPFVIINMSNKEDGIHRNPDDAYIKNIRDTYWKMENIHKPLKGASAYSLSELQEICSKFNIALEDSQTKKKKTMKVLYQELLTCF